MAKKIYTYKRDKNGAFDIPAADKPVVVSSNPELRNAIQNKKAPDLMIYEVCSNCMTEVRISAEKISSCPHCGKEIFPCSQCNCDVDNFKCNWSKEKGCFVFPKK